MANSSSTWDKILLIAACLGILAGGIWAIVDGAIGPERQPIAYGVAMVIIAISNFIVAQTKRATITGRPDVSGSISPPAITKVGGVLDLPWWLWLIDLGLIGIAAAIAHTVLA